MRLREKETLPLLIGLITMLAAAPVQAQFFARFVNPQVEVTMTHPPGFPLEIERAAVIPEEGDPCAEEFGAAVTERFVENGIELVDRQNLDAMFQEMDFGLSGRIDPASAAELGEMLGPSALILVRVQRCAVEKQHLTDKGTTLSGKTVYEYISRTSGWFKGTVRVTDLTTGKIFKTQTIEASVRKENSGDVRWPEYPSEFAVRDAFLDDATRQVHRMFFPWHERKELYFFNDDECDLRSAYELMEIGEIDSAAERSEENLEKCKTADVKRKFLARAYYNLGMTRFLQSRFDEALDLLKTAHGVKSGDIISESIAECRRAQRLSERMAELDESGGFELPSAGGSGGVRQASAGEPSREGRSRRRAAGGASGAGGGSASIKERLQKVESLHDQGLITDEEYQAKREEILEEI